MCEGDGMEEWKECKLGDICKTNINSYSEKDNWSFVNYLDTGNITENKISDIQFIDLSSESLPSRARRKVQINDIIYSTVRPNQKHFGIIKNQPENFLVSTGFAVLHINKTIADPNFIFYNLIQNENTESLHAIAEQTTSAYPAIKPSDIENLSIKLPPLPTQQKIVAILSSLDDKIELNNKISTNLEQQAQALFKNWFVDFEPFGGKMPEGWKVGKLSEYCNFQEGYVNPAQTHNEYFDGDVKWLRAVDINESFILNTSRTLTKCGFESAGKSAFLFKPGSIAISKSGTVGRLGIISDFMCGNRAVIGIELKEQQNLSYIHQYLKSRQTEFPDMAVGSVQKNLYVSILENLDIIIPSKEVLEKFAAICIPFYDQIKTNCVENNNLSSIRDILLPKLMNGEIGVLK